MSERIETERNQTRKLLDEIHTDSVHISYGTIYYFIRMTRGENHPEKDETQTLGDILKGVHKSKSYVAYADDNHGNQLSGHELIIHEPDGEVREYHLTDHQFAGLAAKMLFAIQEYKWAGGRLPAHPNNYLLSYAVPLNQLSPLEELGWELDQQGAPYTPVSPSRKDKGSRGK